MFNAISILTIFLSILLANTPAMAELDAPVLLSNPPSNIVNFSINANSEYVVFNQFEQGDRDDIGNRLSIRIDGSNPANILRSNILFSTEVEFSLDNDDERVISLDSSTGGLLSTSLNGQPAISLLAPNNERIIEFSESNDNTQFQVFLTDQGNLYSINSDGNSPAILLSSNINTAEGEFVDLFRVSPDRLNVIFITLSSNDTSFDQNIFSVPINGSLAPTSIHDVPPNVNISNSILIDNSSSRVIYTLNTAASTQLFSTLIDGSSAPVTLSDGLIISEFQGVFINFKISNDSQSIVFSVEDSSTGLSTLFAVPADGNKAPIVIDEALEFDDFKISNNSKIIIYTPLTALRSSGGQRDILSASINGNSPPVSLLNASGLNREIIEVSTSSDFVISNNSEYVVFQAENNSTFTTELFIAQANGTSPAINLISGIGFFENIGIIINEQQSNIVFRASEQLLSVNFDGTDLTTLSREQDGRVSSDFLVSPDGNFIVYAAQEGLFSLNLNKPNNELCFPIRARNGNFVTICL